MVAATRGCVAAPLVMLNNLSLRSAVHTAQLSEPAKPSIHHHQPHHRHSQDKPSISISPSLTSLTSQNKPGNLKASAQAFLTTKLFDVRHLTCICTTG